MLKKQFIKTRHAYKVTFSIPKKEYPEGISKIKSVHLVGDFNDWSKKATPMEQTSKGDYKAVVDLEPGKSYRFRYLVNSTEWANEWHADAYEPNEFGGDNCIIHLPAE